MTEFIRGYLALFFIFVAVFYIARILIFKKRSGISPVFPGVPGSAHFVSHMTFRIFRLLILGACVARFFWPGLDRFLLPIHALWHPVILGLGASLMALGVGAAIGVNFYMDRNWRSGTHPEERTELITTGPFAYCRNPMMLSVLVAQLGFFMALPSVFSLICLFAGMTAVVAQTRVEERILQKRHGAAYAAYQARVPRWPGLGGQKLRRQP